MNTYTPRDGGGRFESWNERVSDAARRAEWDTRRKADAEIRAAGEYGSKDAAIGMALFALGALAYEGARYVWVSKDMSRKIKRFFS